MGYDGINDASRSGGQYVVFNPEQIKSADPVTYDDNGNVIPLSERFNSSEQDIRYSIARDTNGETFVKVEDDILANDGRSYAQIISDIIRNKFNGLVKANGQDIKLNSRTSGKWIYSKYSQDLLKNNADIFKDKVRSINNIDEILSGAKSWINERSKHGNFPQFARGIINFKVGDNGYSADVVVGIGNDGSATLYDLVNITAKTITEAPIAPVDNNVSRRNGTSVDNTISPSAEDVKHEEGASFSRVRDKAKIAQLDKEDYVTTYRAMALIDGKLYAPMATYIGGKLTEGAE